MDCDSCGAENPENSNYCQKCGELLQSGPNASAEGGDGEGRSTDGDSQETPDASAGQPKASDADPTGAGQASPRSGRDGGRESETSGGSARGDAQAAGAPGADTARAAGAPGGGDARAADAPGGGNARAAGTPGQRGPPAQPGASTSPGLTAILNRLPWRAGIVAGGLLYGLLFAVIAGPFVFFDVRDGVELATMVFVDVLTFVSLSDIAVGLATAVGETPGELGTGQYDALFGVVLLVVPWLLYASGKKFATWNDADPDDLVVGYLGTGAAVVFGTVPVVAIVSLLFGGDVANDTLVAGLLVPGLAGGFGGLMAWVFRDRSRAASWGSGIVTGIVGFVLLLGVTTLWAGDGANLAANSGMSRVFAALVAFVSVATVEFPTSGNGLLAYVAVVLPLLGMAYVRTTRTDDRITDLFEGARTGASLVAGFSTFSFTLLAVVTFLLTPEGSEWLFGANIAPGLFLPESGSGIVQIATLEDFLWGVGTAAVIFPVVVGGLGGALGAYRLRSASAQARQPGTPPQGPPQSRTPNRPGDESAPKGDGTRGDASQGDGASSPADAGQGRDDHRGDRPAEGHTDAAAQSSEETGNSR